MSRIRCFQCCRLATEARITGLGGVTPKQQGAQHFLWKETLLPAQDSSLLVPFQNRAPFRPPLSNYFSILRSSPSVVVQNRSHDIVLPRTLCTRLRPLHASSSSVGPTADDESRRNASVSANEAGFRNDKSASTSGAGVSESPERTPGQSWGQNFNLAGIRITLGLLFGGKKALGVPHIAIPDVRWIDWGALKAAGFQGVVFDKDNTLTVPYAMEIHEPLAESLQECQRVFEGKVVLLSNSAGLAQFDPDGKEASLLERKLGIPVLRHGAKKPAGSSDALTKHFGCSTNQLVMVGDRYFTDIVFGNRHGMLTIRPAPLTAVGEPTMVKKVRLLEATLLSRWQAKDISAPEHKLAQAPGQFIKDPGCW